MGVECTACSKRLPKSAFAKAELTRGGNGRCRDCAQRVACVGCRQALLPAQLDAKSTCRRCRENAQVDRLLQTPSDEVTHFGVEHALRLSREAEHEVLLACQRRRVHERLILQNILDFLRVPYVTTQNGMHYCELCNTTFSEMAVSRGSTVHFAGGADKVNWKGCPEPHLVANTDDAFVVAELWKSPNGRWFFRTLAAPPPRNDLPGESLIADEGTSLPSHDRKGTNRKVVRAGTFESFWAPLDRTVEGRQASPLAKHLREDRHAAHQASISSGKLLLVSSAAIALAKKLGEDPLVSLGRFKAGLGIEERFCEPKHMSSAEELIRARDIHIPVKFLRETLVNKSNSLWITPCELRKAEEAYEEKRSKKGSKKDSSESVPEERVWKRIQA